MWWPHSRLVCFCWPEANSNEFKWDKRRTFNISTSSAFCYPFSPLSIPPGQYSQGWEQQAGQQWEREEGSVWTLPLHLNNNCHFWFATHTVKIHGTNIVRKTSVPSIQLNQEKVMKLTVKIMVGKMSQFIGEDFLACEEHYKSQRAGHWTSSRLRRESTACCADSDWLPKLMAGKWWVHHPLVYLRTHRTSFKRI